MATYRLNERYPGYIEAVSPYSVTHKRTQIGAEGDEVKVLRQWKDTNLDCAWVYIKIRGEEGWVLEYEVDEVLELL